MSALLNSDCILNIYWFGYPSHIPTSSVVLLEDSSGAGLTQLISPHPNAQHYLCEEDCVEGQDVAAP